MPVGRELAASAWAVALAGLALRAGPRALLSVLLLGVAPAVALVAAFSDKFSLVTGHYSKEALEEAKSKARLLERAHSNVLNAGGDSLEWLNFLVERLWPHISKYVENLIRGYESKIQGYMPVGGSSIHFSACTLGKKPLRFGPVRPRIVGAYLAGELVQDGGVELEIAVSYNSDVDIVLSTPIAKMGIADLSLNGTLSIMFRPLMSKSPFIGGMEILFSNPPDVDMDFKGIGNIADMPGVYSAVRRAIDDIIAGLMVSPHRIAFAISGDSAIDLARLRNPPPEGLLRVTVLKAENLEGTDFNLMGARTSDPYVEVKLGAEKWRTSTIKKNCNPVWKDGNVHDFFVYSHKQIVSINVFDEDCFSDDPLGSVPRVTVEELLESVCMGITSFKLGPKNKSEKQPPEGACLHINVEWLRMVTADEAQSEVLSSGNNYVATLKIDECTGLPEEGMRAPYTLRFSVKGIEGFQTTGKGWPNWFAAVTPETLKRITKLASNSTPVPVIAEVLDLECDMVQALLARPAGEDDQTWIRKLETSRRACKASSNPQFEEVLRLLLPRREVTAVVELLNSAKRPTVVGRFEATLGKVTLNDGPFTLLDPASGKALSDGKGGPDAKLHGRLQLRYLGK